MRFSYLSFLVGAALMGLTLWALGIIPTYIFSEVKEFLVGISPLIAAIATVFIAYFTLILKQATDRLWSASERQLTLFGDTAEREFRAYIVGVALFGVPKGRLGTREQYRPKASDYTGPWRFHILNFGKTPGVILKVEWGKCPDSEFPRQTKVSDIIDKNLLPNRMQRTIEGMNEICLPDPKPQQYRHIQLDERVVGEVIFGRITYNDIFRKRHHSTFAILILTEYTDTITMSFADDWT
jgi:hypothetical protein